MGIYINLLLRKLYWHWNFINLLNKNVMEPLFFSPSFFFPRKYSRSRNCTLPKIHSLILWGLMNAKAHVKEMERVLLNWIASWSATVLSAYLNSSVVCRLQLNGLVGDDLLLINLPSFLFINLLKFYEIMILLIKFTVT